MSDMDILAYLGIAQPVVEAYGNLANVPGAEEARLRLLDDARRGLLDEIHRLEAHVMKIDCMRHELRKAMAKE